MLIWTGIKKEKFVIKKKILFGAGFGSIVGAGIRLNVRGVCTALFTIAA